MTAKITLTVPPAVRAGSTCEVEFTVETDETIGFERLELVMTGIEGWYGHARGRRISHHSNYLDHRIAVAPAGTLAPGRYNYRVTVPVPSDAPPTHDTTPAYAWLRLVGVMVRRFPLMDVTFTAWLDVRRQTDAVFAPEPVVAASEGQELTVSIASRRLAIGQPVVGWISIRDDYGRAMPVTVQLIARTTPYGNDGPGITVRYPWRYQTCMVPKGAIDQPFPFELALPPRMPPGFKSRTHERSWLLAVRTQGRLFVFSHRVEIELEITDPVQHHAPPLEAPEIGTRRISSVFVAFATAHGWATGAPDAAAADGDLVRPRITLADGALDLELGVTYSADGLAVIARALVPSLEVGLDVEPSSPLRELLTRDVEADIPAWDRRHHVDAREPEQAKALLRAIVPELLVASTLGELVRWTDTEILFSRPITWIEADELGRMAAELSRIGLAIVGHCPPASPYR